MFCLPVILLISSIEILLRHIPNDYSYKKEYLDKESRNIKILFLGSSHSYFDVNPEFIKPVSFNAAHVAQPLSYDYEILKKYKNRWDSLQYIVVPIDYVSLYTRGLARQYVKNYVIYYGIDIEGRLTDYFELANGKIRDKLSMLCEYYLHKKDNITCNKYGWGVSYPSQSSQDLITTGKTRAYQHTINGSDSFVKSNVTIVNKIIAFAKAKNVKVIFYTSPSYKTYTEHLNKSRLDSTISIITEISRTNNNTRYYNLLDMPTFTDKDFWDGDHLNDFGAKKLTFILKNIIETEKF